MFIFGSGVSVVCLFCYYDFICIFDCCGEMFDVGEGVCIKFGGSVGK